jgi:ketosteroid isomerase-like protein
MSKENIETMRTALDAFNRRDGESFNALLTEDAEIVPVRAALEGTTYRAAEAAAHYCAAVQKSWEDLEWEIDELRDGDDWVLAVGRIRGQGRDSGAAIESRAGWVAHFRDGLIAKFQTYADRAEALKAIGVQE